MSAENLILLFQALYVATALGTMVIVISENRNPLKTISWVLILLLLPLVGLIVYYFFGEDNRKKRLISHKIHQKLESPLEEQNGDSLVQQPEKYTGLISMLNAEGETPLYRGNDVVFYDSGEEKFEALIEAIKNAKQHIHIQYYIYMDDKIGKRLAELLKQKVAEGVEVRLIYDDVGSWKVKRKFFKDLDSHGVQTQAFLRVKFKRLASRVNYRNHRKLVVIDGTIGFMGGMNVADRYIEGLSFGIWRDSHIKIEGLAVAGMQASFLIDWYSSRGEILSRSKCYPKLEARGNCLIQLPTSGPVGPYKSIHMGILQAINTAKKKVYIQTPYFIPTDALMLSIQMAAMRGVDVRLMIPEKSDAALLNVASKSFLSDVLDAGGDVYFYQRGFLHSKLMIIDDELTITGSANMDVRSFEHNFEIDAFIYSKKTCEMAKAIFLEDSVSSIKVNREEWERRGRFNKFKESVLRLFSPLL